MKKRFLIAVAMIALPLLSCTKEARVTPEQKPVQTPAETPAGAETVVFAASTDSPTRTYMSQDGEVYRVLWSAGDVINVNGTNMTLMSEDQPDGFGPGCDKGYFQGNKPSANYTSPKYKAIYPASLRDRYGNFVLPTEQSYLAGGVSGFPMYATNDEGSFSFKNLCGLICISLKGEKSISSISLVDKAGSPKPMSGNFTVTEDAAVISSGSNGTAIICSTPVELNTSTFTPFFITVPAGTYGELQIIIEASDGSICTKTSKNPITVERSKIKPIELSNLVFKDETAQITYTTTNTTKPNIYAAGASTGTVFGDNLTVVSHNYDPDTKTGVITFSGPVTTIGYQAFQTFGNLLTMTIPNTVTSIGTRAFLNCGHLVSLNFPRSLTSIGVSAFQNTNEFVPDDMTHITTIGEDAFNSTTFTGTLTLWENLESLGARAFKCSKITAVVIDHTPATMGTYIFDSCNSLTSVTINDDISIPDGMFSGCQNLMTVEFNADVPAIGTNAFAACYKLNNVVLSPATKTLNQNAFANCTALTSITLPIGITSIGNYAFQNCGFTAMPENWGQEGLSYGSQPYVGCPITSITFPDHWTEVPNSFCSGWKSLQEVDLGAGITTLRGNAFRYCSALIDPAKIPIPARVNNIDSYCFSEAGLTGLPEGLNRTGITWGNNIFNNSGIVSVDISNWTSVPNSCFSNCKKLTSVTLGNNLTELQGYAFYQCTALTSVTLPASLNNLGQYAFCGSGLTDLPAGLKAYSSVGNNVFSGTPLTEITFPSGYTTVPASMFSGCTQLHTIHLNDVTELGNSAFSSCSALATVDAPNLQIIGNNAIDGATSLLRINLPAIRSIKESAFNACYNLREVDLGEYVQSLGSNVFNNIPSPGLQTLYIRRTDAICTLYNKLNSYTSHPIPLIFVPAGLIDAYKADSKWSYYSDYLRPIGDDGDKSGSIDDYSNGGNL